MNITLRRHERSNFPVYSPAYHRRQGIYPKALQGITAVESSGSSGISEVSWYPPGYTPYFFHSTQHICPRIPRGFLIAPDQDNSHRLPQLSATGTRAASYGVLCPGVLPYPCLGQVAHQVALTDREGGMLRIAWMTALLPKAAPLTWPM